MPARSGDQAQAWPFHRRPPEPTPAFTMAASASAPLQHTTAMASPCAATACRSTPKPAGSGHRDPGSRLAGPPWHHYGRIHLRPVAEPARRRQVGRCRRHHAGRRRAAEHLHHRSWSPTKSVSTARRVPAATLLGSRADFRQPPPVTARRGGSSGVAAAGDRVAARVAQAGGDAGAKGVAI